MFIFFINDLNRHHFYVIIRRYASTAEITTLPGPGLDVVRQTSLHKVRSGPNHREPRQLIAERSTFTDEQEITSSTYFHYWPGPFHKKGVGTIYAIL